MSHADHRLQPSEYECEDDQRYHGSAERAGYGAGETPGLDEPDSILSRCAKGRKGALARHVVQLYVYAMHDTLQIWR